MHNLLIFACCAVSVSYSAANHSSISEIVTVSSIRNETLVINAKKAVSKFLNKSEQDGGLELESSIQDKNASADINLDVQLNEKRTSDTLEHNTHGRGTQHSLHMLRKIHARITHSKDAVWATITLTFICVLLVLAVAQSRMWKDHYYKEGQGVPLPNFNERVLFKDVMEHKITSLKKFFKKKSKEKNTTELESLLPPSEWDN